MAAGETIYIGCKLPMGITLDLDRVERVSAEHQAVRTIKGKMAPVTLKGDPQKWGVVNPLNIDGYVFTPIPLDFWMAWLAQNEDSPLLADRLIMPAKTMDAAGKIAREHEKERGMAPRLAENDPRTRDTRVKAFDQRDDGIAA